MDITSSVKKIAQDALVASRMMARLSSDVKNAALLRMADELTWRSDFIIAENNRDVNAAREKGLSAALIDRLLALPPSVTVLLIDHDMDLVFRFADRISVLVAGTILTEGPPAQIAKDAQVRAVYLGEETHV